MTVMCVPACYVTRCEVSLAPYNYFPVLSFTYVGAMVTSNASLAYITYPTQVGVALYSYQKERGRQNHFLEPLLMSIIIIMMIIIIS